MSDSRFNELSRLLAAMCDGELPPAEAKRVEQLIANDPEARQFYLRYIDLHVNLVDVAQRIEVNDGPPADVGAPSESGTKPTTAGFPSLGTWMSGGISGSTIPLVMLSIAMLAIGAGFGYAAGVTAGTVVHESTQLDEEFSAGVATFSATDECQWAEGAHPFTAGSRLFEHDVLRLSAGSAEVAFDSGASIRAVGPATLILRSRSMITLDHGRIQAQAAGARLNINTPTTALMEISGELAVDVDGGGSTELDVIEGTVDVQPDANRALVRGYQRVAAGQTRRIASRDALTPLASEIANLEHPTGLVFGPGGDLYVTSQATDSVVRFDGETGALLGEFVPPGSGGLDFPCDLTFGPDGHLYVCSGLGNSIIRYDGRTGECLGVFVAPQAGGLQFPFGLTFGPDGNLYVSGATNHRILRFDGQSGEYLDSFVDEGSGGLDVAGGFAFGPDGHLYVASHHSNAVLRYDGATGEFIDTVIGPDDGVLVRPVSVRFGPHGELFVASLGDGAQSQYGGRGGVAKYDPDTGALLAMFVAGHSDVSGAGFPQYVAFGPNGDLFVTSFDANAVQRYDRDTGKFIATFASGWPQAQAIDR